MNCPNCQSDWEVNQTPYRPPPGIDLALREYHCPHCDLDFYAPRPILNPLPDDVAQLTFET